MGNLNFINRVPVMSGNPVLEGYDEAQTRAYQGKLRDLGLQRTQQDLDTAKQEYGFRQEEHPYKVRSEAAGADTAESTARVAKGTETPKIDEAQARARGANTQADREAFDYGQEQAMAADKQRQTKAQADRAETESAAEAEQRPGKLRQVNAAARGAEASASNTASTRDYEYYTKAMEALARGDVDIAQQYAGLAHKTLPPELLNSREHAIALDKINKEAARRYPNRPADQQAWAQAAAKAMTDAMGNFKYDPQKTLDVQGAPQPPEQAYSLARAPSASDPNLAGLAPRDAALVRTLVTQHQMKNPDGIFPATVPDKDAIVRILQSTGRSDLAQQIYNAGIPGRIPFSQLNRGGPVTQSRPPVAPAPAQTPPFVPPQGPQAPVGTPGGTPPYVPQARAPYTPLPPPLPNGRTGEQALGEARAAIARGAPRDAVIKRLEQYGVDVSGL